MPRYGSLRHRKPTLCILKVEDKGVYVAQFVKGLGKASVSLPHQYWSKYFSAGI